MATEYKLSYTASEINKKLGKIDGLVTSEERLSEEIATERARINQFTSLGEGSTTGDAELQDIRIGYDGKTYTTAGEAVRGQTGGLSARVDTVENHIVYNGYDTLYGHEWALGAINPSKGNVVDTTSRMHCLSVFPLSCQVTVSQGADVIFSFWDSNVKYISSSDWRSDNNFLALSDIAPENSAYFGMTVRYTDNSEIVDVNALSAMVEVTNEYVFPYCVRGAIEASTGEETTNARRLRSTPYYFTDLVVVPQSNVAAKAYFYNVNNNLIGETGDFMTDAFLLKEYAPSETAYCRFVIKDINDASFTDSDPTNFKFRAYDIMEYQQGIHLYHPLSKEYVKHLSKAFVDVTTAYTELRKEYISDVPENIGVLNTIMNMKQMAEIKYTPLAIIPQNKGDFAVGVERTGLPYSSSRPEALYVPNNVSFHTFMTAMQNPNSYLYTVDLGESGNQNGDTYYGAVCSTACGYALGILPNYSTPQWADIPDMEVIENQSAYGLKLCDTIVGKGHVVMITDITRNRRGKIGHITITEASYQNVHSTNYTPEELEAAYPPTDYKYCRYTKLYSVKHEQNEYVAVEDETPRTVTYNTQIIPRKGDKANWLTSQDVVIDILEIGNYTGVEIYRDDTLLETKPITSVITLSGLQAGSYKARLTDGTNTSDWCYWIIVDAVSSVVPLGSDGKVNVTFSATNAIPLWVQWTGITNGTAHISVLTEEEKTAGAAVCTNESGTFKVRVAFQTEYGIIHSELPETIEVL